MTPDPTIAATRMLCLRMDENNAAKRYMAAVKGHKKGIRATRKAWEWAKACLAAAEGARYG